MNGCGRSYVTKDVTRTNHGRFCSHEWPKEVMTLRMSQEKTMGGCVIMNGRGRSYDPKDVTTFSTGHLNIYQILRF